MVTLDYENNNAKTFYDCSNPDYESKTYINIWDYYSHCILDLSIWSHACISFQKNHKWKVLGYWVAPYNSTTSSLIWLSFKPWRPSFLWPFLIFNLLPSGNGRTFSNLPGCFCTGIDMLNVVEYKWDRKRQSFTHKTGEGWRQVKHSRPQQLFFTSAFVSRKCLTHTLPRH